MGYIFHTLCELMPLFAGLSVATEEMTTEMLPAMTTFTGWALYLVPLVGLLCSCYGKQRWSTIVSFVLACLTLLLNMAPLHRPPTPLLVGTGSHTTICLRRRRPTRHRSLERATHEQGAISATL